MKELKTVIRENTWLDRGWLTDFGWGNGYVLIPEGHPLHGKHYHDIENIDVHYGLTFSTLVTDKLIERCPELTEEDKGMWVVGFNTTHYGDNLAVWPKARVQQETDHLLKQLQKYGN